MAEVTVTTESGSVYVLDSEAKTWKRNKGDLASNMRSDEGTFVRVHQLAVGEPLVLLCPPFNPSTPVKARGIFSTPVVKIDGPYKDYALW